MGARLRKITGIGRGSTKNSMPSATARGCANSGFMEYLREKTRNIPERLNEK